MQTYSIIIRPEAKKDLIDIWSYVAFNDLPGKADVLYELLKEKCYSLSYIPQRGRCVPEFKNIGIFDIYEILSKPYRIVYKIQNTSVVIYGVFDGRRELSEILSNRVFGSSKLEYN